MKKITTAKRFETYTLTVAGRTLTVRPFINNDRQYFHIYENGRLLFTLTLNSEDAWVKAESANTSTQQQESDDDFASHVGFAIEKFDIN